MPKKKAETYAERRKAAFRGFTVEHLINGQAQLALIPGQVTFHPHLPKELGGAQLLGDAPVWFELASFPSIAAHYFTEFYPRSFNAVLSVLLRDRYVIQTERPSVEAAIRKLLSRIPHDTRGEPDAALRFLTAEALRLVNRHGDDWMREEVQDRDPAVRNAWADSFIEQFARECFRDAKVTLRPSRAGIESMAFCRVARIVRPLAQVWSNPQAYIDRDVIAKVERYGQSLGAAMAVLWWKHFALLSDRFRETVESLPADERRRVESFIQCGREAHGGRRKGSRDGITANRRHQAASRVAAMLAAYAERVDAERELLMHERQVDPEQADVIIAEERRDKAALRTAARSGGVSLDRARRVIRRGTKPR